MAGYDPDCPRPQTSVNGDRADDKKNAANERWAHGPRNDRRLLRKRANTGWLFVPPNCGEEVMLGFTSDPRPTRSRRTLTPPAPCRRAQPFRDGGVEPAVEDLLSDPITKALMRSDGLNPDMVRTIVAAARRKLQARDAVV